MSRRARWTLGVVGALVAAGLLLPAAADWLVTRDGTPIETDGPWRVENRLVVFKQPDGSYASLRLADVDLAESERLTRDLAERLRAPKPVPEPEPRRVVARLTEKDLPPVGSEDRRNPAAREPAGDEAGTEPESGATESLQVVSWREESGPGSPGLEFIGDVRNVTDRMALGVDVTVSLFDETGEEIESGSALLTASALPPRQSAGFRASFPGVYHYARVEFRTAGNLVLTSDSALESATDAEAAPEEPPGTGR